MYSIHNTHTRTHVYTHAHTHTHTHTHARTHTHTHAHTHTHSHTVTFYSLNKQTNCIELTFLSLPVTVVHCTGAGSPAGGGAGGLAEG